MTPVTFLLLHWKTQNCPTTASQWVSAQFSGETLAASGVKTFPAPPGLWRPQTWGSVGDFLGRFKGCESVTCRDQPLIRVCLKTSAGELQSRVIPSAGSLNNLQKTVRMSSEENVCFKLQQLTVIGCNQLLSTVGTRKCWLYTFQQTPNTLHLNVSYVSCHRL